MPNDAQFGDFELWVARSAEYCRCHKQIDSSHLRKRDDLSVNPHLVPLNPSLANAIYRWWCCDTLGHLNKYLG